MAEQPQSGKEHQKSSAKRPDRPIRARIVDVEGRKNGDIPITGIELRLEVEDVSATNKFLEVWFVYLALYQPEVGFVRMRGLLMVEMTEETAAHHAREWAATKKFDQQLAAALLQQVNYRCGSEAIFICKLIDLPSPLMPPPIAVGAPTAEQSKKRAASQPAAAQTRPAVPAPPQVAPQQTPPAPAPQQAFPPPPAQPTTRPSAAPSTVPFNYISPFTGKKPS